jgi:hypothetical protein
VLDKKDLDLYETQNKLKKYETEYRVVDEMKKQIHFLKKQNEEYRIQLRGAKEVILSFRYFYMEIFSSILDELNIVFLFFSNKNFKFYAKIHKIRFKMGLIKKHL